MENAERRCFMIKASIVKEVVVRVGDRVGALAEILAPIAEARLNLLAINTLSVGNEAKISLVAEDTAKVVALLQKSGVTPWEQEVVAVEIANEAGAVAEVASKLAQKEVDIRSLWASTAVGLNTTLYLWTSDNAAAIKVIS